MSAERVFGQCYDRQGKPITVTQFSWLKQDPNYSTVARERGFSLVVSTVWIGMDHNFSDQGPPLIFESMVFRESEDGETDLTEVTSRRYATEAEAREGHAQLVKKYVSVVDKIAALHRKDAHEGSSTGGAGSGDRHEGRDDEPGERPESGDQGDR